MKVSCPGSLTAVFPALPYKTASSESITEMSDKFNRIFPLSPESGKHGEVRGCNHFRSIILQKITATAVLTAVARMPAPTMDAGAALPYWLR